MFTGLRPGLGNRIRLRLLRVQLKRVIRLTLPA